MSENYNTRTASLKATIADIRNLDAKKIVLNGEDILDRISDAEFHSYDTRDPQLKNDELDIWNTEISLSDNGCVEVKPHIHSVIGTFTDGLWIYTYEGMTESQANTIKTAVKVVDNEVLGANDTHIMYWLTDGLTNGLTIFEDCTSLTSFSGDLSNLTNGANMFFSCSNLTSFTTDLSSLTEGTLMFHACTNLTSFASDLSSLVNGYSMFYACTNLTSFTSDLSSLEDGTEMFLGCKLDAQSVVNILQSLPTVEDGSSRLIHIDIGCEATEEDQLLFAQECDCETLEELLQDFMAKNWDMTFNCNGRP